MSLTENLAERLAFLGGGAAWLLAGGTAAMAEPCVLMAGAAAGLGSIGVGEVQRRLKTKDPKTFAAIKQVQDKIAADKRFARHISDVEVDLDAIREAETLLVQHVVSCWPTPRALARLAATPAGFPKAVAQQVVLEIAPRPETRGLFDPASDNFRPDAHGFAHDVVEAALDAALEERAYFETLEPHLVIEQLNLTVEVQSSVAQLTEEMTCLGELMGRVESKVDQILDLLKAQSDAPSDPFAEESIRQTLKRLMVAQDGKRKAAAEHLRRDPPDEKAAVRDLKQLAAEQDDGVAESAAKAAETHREIAALTYYNDGEEAVRALEKVLAYAPGDAVSRNQLGLLLKRLGRLDEAKKSFESLLTLHTDDKVIRAAALGNLGLIARVRGDLEGAEAYHRQSLALEEELGRKEGMANQLGNLGLIVQIRGDLEGADAYHRQSLALEEELGRKEGMASDLGNLGLIARRRGDLEGAEAYHRQSLALEEELGRKEGMANQLGNLGLIAQTRGDFEGAETYHRQSLALNEELGRKEGMAASLGNFGLIAQVRGDLEGAETYLKESLALDKELGRKEGMASDLGNLGLIARTRGDLEGAEAYHRQSLALEEELGRKEGMASELGNLGNVAFDRGDVAAACQFYRQAEALFAEIGMSLQLEQVRALIAERCPGDHP